MQVLGVWASVLCDAASRLQSELGGRTALLLHGAKHGPGIWAWPSRSLLRLSWEFSVRICRLAGTCKQTNKQKYKQMNKYMYMYVYAYV